MIPKISPMLFGAFARYTQWYLRRNFNSVRISTDGAAPAIPAERPIVVYLNHPSWWDPLICLQLATSIWPDRKHYAPIDQAALMQYPMLDRLGFFGIEKGTRRGSATFMRDGSEILSQPNVAIWITAEGAFTDPRDRSRPILPGVAHLLKRLPAIAVIPLAIEYPFWQERRPEALCRFGNPVSDGDRLELALRIVQDELAVQAMARRPERFKTMIAGKAGINFVYDAWRRLQAWITRRPYATHHGDVTS